MRCTLFAFLRLSLLGACACRSATGPTASQLAFSVHPPNAFVGGAPTVQVIVQDVSGTTVTKSTIPVTVAIGTNPSGGQLSGTTTVNAVNGVALFGDLGLDKAGTGYTLTASAAGLTGTASTAFNVLAFASVSAGGESTCGVTTGGVAYCWGDNARGELGNGTSTGSTAPVAVSGGLTFTAVSTGDAFACGITAAGAAYCWGFNGQGNLGTGTSTGPQQCAFQESCSTVPVAVAEGLTFSAVTVGGDDATARPVDDAFACGLTTSGVAYCWGGNTYGELGTGTFANSSTPVAVAGGLTFTSISAGRLHTCGTTPSGAAYCWGSNCFGQRGDGGPTGSACPGGPSSSVPVAVTGGLSFAAVSAADGYFTCGVTTSGAAYCWGGGWLGDGTLSADNPTPVAVAGGLTFATVSVGRFRACGVTVSGVAYCWGENTYGQIGNGALTTASTPVRVAGGLTFATVRAGGGWTSGVTTAGGAYSWGFNGDGELGNGRTTDSGVPVNVRGAP